MGYREKLDDVEDRLGWLIKPASWAACAIGGAAVYWGMGRAIWTMLADSSGGAPPHAEGPLTAPVEAIPKDRYRAFVLLKQLQRSNKGVQQLG